MAKSIGELKGINVNGDASKLDKDTKFFAFPVQKEKDVDGIFDRSVTYDQLEYYGRQVIGGAAADVPIDVDDPAADLAALNERCHEDNLVASLNKENERAEAIEGVDANGELSLLESEIEADNLVEAINNEYTRAKTLEGLLQDLETTNTDNLVAAINSEHEERTTDSGDISALPTIDAATGEQPENLVQAITQLLMRLGANEQEVATWEENLTSHRTDGEAHKNVIGLLADLNAPAATLVAAINALEVEAREVEHDATLEGQGTSASELKVAADLVDKINAAGTAQALSDHEADADAHGLDVVKQDVEDLKLNPVLDVSALADGEYKLVITGGVAAWELV